MRLVQVARGAERRVGVVDESTLRLVAGYANVYVIATAAMESGIGFRDEIDRSMSDETLDYDAIYAGQSEWRVLPVIDHPADPARLLVTGTGLTHQRSADQRQAMHAADAKPTDSLRMYEWGVEGGRPEPGKVGTAPEWFYKGNGTLLKGHGDPLTVSAYADDGGEEPEIAGIYIIDTEGTPRRLGMAIGNEFSDHVLEKKNYLYLAASKLRNCSVGPELVLDADFSDARGKVAIERDGAMLWSREIRSGEAAMSHSLANLEHHHFKFEGHRRPGDVHVHYFGADAFSFGAGIALQNGDVMWVGFEGFGRPLGNPVRIDRSTVGFVQVSAL
jgi:hypothetical protein